MRGKHNLGSLRADPLLEKVFGDNLPQGESFYWQHLKAEKQRPVQNQNVKPKRKTTEIAHNILDVFTSPSTKKESYVLVHSTGKFAYCFFINGAGCLLGISTKLLAQDPSARFKTGRSRHSWNDRTG